MGLTLKGLELLAKDAGGLANSNFIYVAIGDGSTAAQDTDTTLVHELTLYGAARKLANVTYVSPGTLRLDVTYSFTGNGNVREVAAFDASSGGNMLFRRVWTENQPFTDGSSFEYTADIYLSAKV